MTTFVYVESIELNLKLTFREINLRIPNIIGNIGIKLLRIYHCILDILCVVASERIHKHEMVSSRGSFTGAEESPGSHTAEMPVVFVPPAKVGSRLDVSADGE